MTDSRILREMFPIYPHSNQRAEAPTLKPVNHDQRTRNPLRPGSFDEMIGQERLKGFLRRVVAAVKQADSVLDHVLLVGPSGAGKSTIAGVIANELGVDCYQLQAPVDHDTLLELRTVLLDGDVLFIDEVHLQAIQERRGKTAGTQPEQLFNIMEDRTIVTATGVLEYPEVTVIAATTDEGMLPDPFINRFPLRPVIEPYTSDDLTQIARLNAQVLGCRRITDSAARIFADAARGVPRHINNYIRNAITLSRDITDTVAREVVTELNQTTLDGLTYDQQAVLRFLYTRCRRETTDGRVRYQAGVGTLATAIGKSRDQKAVALRVEPYLIAKGLLQVGSGGRSLTPAGIERAKELLDA